jgi:hypothetical protein
MKEEDYINATDLAKLRMLKIIANDLFPKERMFLDIKRLNLSIDIEIECLHKEVNDEM